MNCLKVRLRKDFDVVVGLQLEACVGPESISDIIASGSVGSCELSIGKLFGIVIAPLVVVAICTVVIFNKQQNDKARAQAQQPQSQQPQVFIQVSGDPAPRLMCCICLWLFSTRC